MARSFRDFVESLFTTRFSFTMISEDIVVGGVVWFGGCFRCVPMGALYELLQRRITIMMMMKEEYQHKILVFFCEVFVL
jgi:hypothetical protein